MEDIEEEDCSHEKYDEDGFCIECGLPYEEDDFSGATPGDR